MNPLRIAYAIINCNRHDGGARAVSEVAERIALNHEVHLFARRVEEIDFSHIEWHKMPGPSWPEILDFSTYHALAEFAISSRRFDIVHSVGNNAMAANVITIQNIQPAKREAISERSEQSRISIARRFTRWLYLETTTAIEKRAYTHRP